MSSAVSIETLNSILSLLVILQHIVLTQPCGIRDVSLSVEPTRKLRLNSQASGLYLL